MTAKYNVHGVIADAGFSFNLDDHVGETFIADLDRSGSDYQIHVLIKDGKNGSIAQFEIYRLNFGECQTALQADIIMPQSSDGSVWQAQTKDGDNLFLVIQPVFSS